MATTNTTDPISLRGGFVPVLRYGNFAGPGYSGGMGPETRIKDPAINNGQEILVLGETDPSAAALCPQRTRSSRERP